MTTDENNEFQDLHRKKLLLENLEDMLLEQHELRENIIYTQKLNKSEGIQQTPGMN